MENHAVTHSKEGAPSSSSQGGGNPETKTGTMAAIAPACAERRILVITTEPLPLAGQATTGAGLRAWGLNEGLRARGFDAIIAAPVPAFSAPYLSGERPLPAWVRAFQRHRVADLLAEVHPDVVILEHWGMAHEVPPLDVPLAIDLHGPHLLERYYWGNPDLISDAEQKLAALRRADFVTCAGTLQRHYFYAWLLLAGFELREQEIPVIPFSAPPPDQWPSPSHREPFSFVYGGVLLAWQDPSRGMRILLEEMDRARRGTLHLFTGTHPVLDASAPHLVSLVAELKQHPRVKFHGIVPHEQLMQQLTHFWIAFDLMAHNPERELAFTSRTMVYLACGLPVIYNDYAEIGELLRRHGGGWALSPTNEEALRKLVQQILAEDFPLEEVSEQARALAGRFTWDRTIEPLAQFCANPFIRPKKSEKLLRVEKLDRELAEERQRRERLEQELATIRGKLLYRVAEKMRYLRRALAPLMKFAMWSLSLYLEWQLRRTGRRPSRS